MPKAIIIISDMEFDYGSSMSKDRTMQLFRSKGYNTKIVWWNLNSRATTAPEMDRLAFFVPFCRQMDVEILEPKASSIK